MVTAFTTHVFSSCGPWKRAHLKGIGGCYRLCIILMLGLIWACRKGAVFVGGGKKVQFSVFFVL